MATDAILPRCNAPRHAPCPDCSVPFSSLHSLLHHQNTALQIWVRPSVGFKEVACPLGGLHDVFKEWVSFVRRNEDVLWLQVGLSVCLYLYVRIYTVYVSIFISLCISLSIYLSIYHGGVLVNHQCQAAEWEMFYKCCLSGGRRLSPGGFNHPPKLPHPNSLHTSISPSAEVLMSPGEVGG